MIASLVAFGSIALQVTAPPKLDYVKDLTPGAGVAAAAGDVATIEFIVRLQSGKEIANTLKRGLSYTFQITEDSNPFSVAAQGMRQAAEREVQFTYPEPGIPGIAPASVPLKVWIKLVSLKPGAGPSKAR